MTNNSANVGAQATQVKAKIMFGSVGAIKELREKEHAEKARSTQAGRRQWAARVPLYNEVHHVNVTYLIYFLENIDKSVTNSINETWHLMLCVCVWHF